MVQRPVYMAAVLAGTRTPGAADECQNAWESLRNTWSRRRKDDTEGRATPTGGVMILHSIAFRRMPFRFAISARLSGCHRGGRLDLEVFAGECFGFSGLTARANDHHRDLRG